MGYLYIQTTKFIKGGIKKEGESFGTESGQMLINSYIGFRCRHLKITLNQNSNEIHEAINRACGEVVAINQRVIKIQVNF